MATSYKIRLKRFNGVDYDILNLSSDNIIMGNGNTLQSIIPSSNGMVKYNNGGFQTAVAGTDYLTLATNYSHLGGRQGLSSYSIVVSDIGMTLAFDQSECAVTLTQAVSTQMPYGSEIALLINNQSESSFITLTLPSGRTYKASGAFTQAKLTGGYSMFAIKKLWDATADVWLITGPNVEVVT